MPLQRRLPKRGFHNPFRIEMTVVNIDQLEAFPSGSEVTPELLAQHGLVSGKDKRKKSTGQRTAIAWRAAFAKTLLILGAPQSSKRP